MTERIADRRPVIIVGAGPTGLTAALELTRLGIDVRIIDRAPSPSTTSKALAIQGRTLELLTDRGVGAELDRLGNKATGAVLYSSGKRVGGVDVTRTPGRHNYILLLPQAETERVLAEALAHLGIKVEYGLTMTTFTNGDAGVSVTLTSADGSEEHFEAAYLIAADGARSQVRSGLGIAFTGQSLPQSYLLGDVLLDADVPQDSLSVYTGSDGFMAIFPLGDNRFRLMILDDDPDGTGGPSIDKLQDLYDRVCPIPGTFQEVLWSSRFRIQSRHVPTVRAGRVFLGGDAAHVHSPAGGQGMNSGIQDMLNLSWKLAMVMKGQALPRLLDTYDTDRMPVIRGLIAMTEKMTTVTNTTSPVAHRALRLLAPLALWGVGLGRNKVQEKAAAKLSQLSISYRDAPSARGGGSVVGLGAGDRVPDWTVLDAGEQRRLYELLDLGTPTLVTLGDVNDSTRDTYLPWADRVALHQVTIAAHQPDLRGLDAKTAVRLANKPAWLLIRPDGYLAAAGDGNEKLRMARWLTDWLGTPAGVS